ncbi:MAG: alpha-glucoside transport system permease protein [Ilumatobacteraceae bacterium]
MSVVEISPTGDVATDAPTPGFQEPIGRSASSALSSKTGRKIVYILVFLWTIPTFGVFVSSFRDEIAVKTTGWWTFLWNPHFTLQNYKSVLGSEGGNDNLSHFFLNSIRITVPATIISVGVALLAAYAFSWMQFKGRDWLFVAVIGMLVVPLQMSLVTLSRLFNGGAHIGTFTIFPDIVPGDSVIPIWIAHTCFGMPFCIFILKNFVSSLPREIIEAARVDGASHLDIFRKLIVPLSVPAIASLCIFQFVYIWNDLLIGRIFGGASNLPLIAKLVEVSGSRGQSWHLLTAAAFVSMALPLVVFFSLQRYFVRGLLAGSVKG